MTAYKEFIKLDSYLSMDFYALPIASFKQKCKRFIIHTSLV